MIRLLIVLALASPAVAAEPASKPNVVVILADDAGYGDFGCYGNKLIRTPHIDRMATEGVRFTDFYVAQAACSASRAALLTGCYPNRVGIPGVLGPNEKRGISNRETTIAGMLKARGYATALFGKWHLGDHPSFLPTRHGFDEFFGLPYSHDMWPRHPKNRSYPDLPLYAGERMVTHNPDINGLTQAYTERAVSFIRRHRDRPFFLYVAHSMPHVPLGASDRFRGKSKAGLYGDVIEELDWSVGQILDTIKAEGLDEKTLVILASDNGPWLSYGNHAGSAGPIREGKGTSWEGGVRVPCVIRWPGRLPAGRVSSEPWMTIDVLPTFATVTGAERPRLKIDGQNVLPLWNCADGARSPHEAYYFYYGSELQAVRAGPWKLHFPHAYVELVGEPGREGQPGKTAMARTGLALYQLTTDPGERHDVAKDHPEVVARLTVLADVMRDELGDSLTQKSGRGIRPTATVP